MSGAALSSVWEGWLDASEHDGEHAAWGRERVLFMPPRGKRFTAHLVHKIGCSLDPKCSAERASARDVLAGRFKVATIADVFAKRRIYVLGELSALKMTTQRLGDDYSRPFGKSDLDDEMFAASRQALAYVEFQDEADAAPLSFCSFDLNHFEDVFEEVELDAHVLDSNVLDARAVPSWLAAVEAGPDVDVSDRALADLFEGIWTLSEEQKYAELEAALALADADRMPSVAIVALLRYSFASRRFLPSWSRFLSAAHQVIALRGGDSETILRGLNAG